MVAAVAVMTAGPALADVGSEPGNLKFSPASGATTLQPTWSTTDGCPVGYQGSAEVSIFDASGVLLSRISTVAYNVIHPFGGTLDGNIAAILRYAHVSNGGALDFAVGCYSETGATGQVKWIQSTLVTLMSGGTSYTSSAPTGQQQRQQSASGAGALGTGAGPEGAPSTPSTGGIGAPLLAGLISAACALAAGTAGFVWYRRRNRSRLM